MRARCLPVSSPTKPSETNPDEGSGALREKIQQLYARHAVKDLPERPFRRALTEYTYRLYTAVAREQLKPGESIRHEHHVIRSHMWWSQSFLKDPNQEMISLYLTERRLIRLRSIMVPGRPISCDEGDQTTVDSLFFDRIDELAIHREVRWGEAAVGLVITVVGLLFYEWLDVTGPVLSIVGILGTLHGLLWPSRWVELTSRVANPTAGAMIIYASRRKSGRRLVRMLRERLAAASARS
jgi:hypothetical protein